MNAESFRVNPFPLLIAMLMALPLTGCGTSEVQRLPIYGQIEVDGKTTISGSVTLVPAAGNSGPSATTQVANGNFRFTDADGPSAGEHKALLDVRAADMPERDFLRIKPTTVVVPEDEPFTVDLSVAAEPDVTSATDGSTRQTRMSRPSATTSGETQTARPLRTNTSISRRDMSRRTATTSRPRPGMSRRSASTSRRPVDRSRAITAEVSPQPRTPAASEYDASTANGNVPIKK